MSANSGARAYELLRQRAKAVAADVQALAISYAIERFMARLMAADDRGAVTVKGGQSLGILFGNQMRPTKDLDINVDASSDAEEWIARTIRRACQIDLGDGLSIEPDGLRLEHREHQGEGGLRVSVPARVHSCRTDFAIDVGVGNEITFEPKTMTVAGVLGGHRTAPPALQTRIYPHENTLAEKIAAKIEDGVASIRHKDFFDVWLSVEILRRAGDLRLLSADDGEMTSEERSRAAAVRTGLADGTLLTLPCVEASGECLDRLGLALARTAAHRGTALPSDLPDWLMHEFGEDRNHSAQWANWCRNQKGRLRFSPPGTGKDDNRGEALATLLRHVGPELAEIAARAAPEAVPGMNP